MRYHNRRLNLSLGGQLICFNQIVIITSGSPQDMGTDIMHIIQIDLCLELIVCRTRKEVHASVKGQKLISHFCNLTVRNIYKYIIISLTACNVAKFLYRIFHLRRIHIEKLYAVFCRLFGRNYLTGTGKFSVINICYHDTFRLILKLNTIADSSKPHRPTSSKDDNISTLFRSSRKIVISLVGVIISMVSSDDAAHRFAKRCFKEAVSFIRHQASQLHYLMGNDTVGARTAEIFIRIPRRCKASFIIQRWLLRKFHAGFKLILPLLTHLDDYSGKLMSDDNRICVNVLWRSFVLFPLLRKLISRHTDTVTHNLYQNLVVLDFRQFKFF